MTTMMEAIREHHAQVSAGPDLSQTTVLIKLEVHAFGNTRKLRESQYEVDGADKSMTSASRRLLKSPELDEVRLLQANARRYVYAESLPFPIDSIHMLPVGKVEDVDAQLRLFNQRIDAAIDKFVEKYDQRVAEAREKNPKVFNPLDYPPKAHVRREFDFSYQFVNVGVPEQQLSRLDPEILAQSRRNCERLWSDAAEMTRQMQVEIMQTLVGKLREKLEDDGTGKPKRFHASTVENLTDFLRQFEKSMNVTQFSELEGLVKEARKVLNGNSAEDLKDSVILRGKVREELTRIERKLVPLVGERKFRKAEE